MLDGHQYLTRQGWKGKGTALRSGGISKPLVVTQKRTLAGLGKDRDEAFPFWEHVFDTSVNAINIKIYGSDTDSDDNDHSDVKDALDVALKRTVTGIISNRRPTDGIIACGEPSSAPTSRLNLLGTAKRELARRQLYSRFYRGPLISNNEDTSVSSSQPSTLSSKTCTPSYTPALQGNPSDDESNDDPMLTVVASVVTPVTADQKDQAEGKAARRARKEERQRKRDAKAARRAARLSKDISPIELVAAIQKSVASSQLAVKDSSLAQKKRKLREEGSGTPMNHVDLVESDRKSKKSKPGKGRPKLHHDGSLIVGS